MTHIDTFDPKPNAPPSVRSFFKPIPTNVPGTEITELLPLLAKLADKYTIIRSIDRAGGRARRLRHALQRDESERMRPARTPRPSWSIPASAPSWA